MHSIHLNRIKLVFIDYILTSDYLIFLNTFRSSKNSETGLIQRDILPHRQPEHPIIASEQKLTYYAVPTSLFAAIQHTFIMYVNYILIYLSFIFLQTFKHFKH